MIHGKLDVAAAMDEELLQGLYNLPYPEYVDRVILQLDEDWAGDPAIRGYVIMKDETVNDVLAEQWMPLLSESAKERQPSTQNSVQKTAHGRKQRPFYYLADFVREMIWDYVISTGSRRIPYINFRTFTEQAEEELFEQQQKERAQRRVVSRRQVKRVVSR